MKILETSENTQRKDQRSALVFSLCIQKVFFLECNSRN